MTNLTINDKIEITRGQQGVGAIIDDCIATIIKVKDAGKVVAERIDNGDLFALNLNVAEAHGLTVKKIS